MDSRNIHAFVIGEHGDSEVVPYSCVTIAGIPLLSYCVKCGKKGCDNIAKLEDIAAKVKYSAYDIISKKGSTYYGVASAVTRIVDAILKDSHSVLTVSTYIDNELDGEIKDIYMSVPSIISSSGVIKTLWPSYTDKEIDELVKSANHISFFKKK